MKKIWTKVSESFRYPYPLILNFFWGDVKNCKLQFPVRRVYRGNCNLHVTHRFWREPPNCKLVRSYVLACEFHDVPHIESTFLDRGGGGLRKSTERERRDSNSLTLIALTLLIEPILVTHEFLMFFISFLCLRDIVMMLCFQLRLLLRLRYPSGEDDQWRCSD